MSDGRRKREREREAWVRIVGLPISLWDRAILRRIGEECGGFLDIDAKTEKMEELQWVRILVKLNGEKIPNTVEIWVENMRYSLSLWWETMPTLRSLSAGERGKPFEAIGEVEGEVLPREGKCVLEDEGGLRLEDQMQSADGTQGQTSGSGRPLDCSQGLAGSPYGPQGVMRSLGRPIKLGLLGEPRSSMLGYGPEGLDPTPSLKAKFSFRPKAMEDPRRAKAWKTIVGFGSARSDDGQSPPQSVESRDHFGVAQNSKRPSLSPSRSPFYETPLFWEKDGQRRLCEVELHPEERSKTDLVLFEEALRYKSDSFQFRCLVSGPYSSPSSFSGRTPLGEYCDLSGDGWERDEGENSFRLLNGTESLVGETVKCWGLMEVNKGKIEELGKEMCSAQIVPRETKAWGELSWEESDLAKFSKFLGFSTEGLEKDIVDFLIKIRKRRKSSQQNPSGEI